MQSCKYFPHTSKLPIFIHLTSLPATQLQRILFVSAMITFGDLFWPVSQRVQINFVFTEIYVYCVYLAMPKNLNSNCNISLNRAETSVVLVVFRGIRVFILFQFSSYDLLCDHTEKDVNIFKNN
jgi:hypothetical protein